MNESIGTYQNSIEQKKKKTKEALEYFKKQTVIAVQETGSLGVKILWLGLCSSVVLYMAVRAVMLAL